MNKTISVNIGGFVFNIEEDAYQKLYHYLQAVRKNFTGEEEREEIMDDVESRIAEIFQARMSGAREVVTMRDVEEVIDIMGKPEDYLSDEVGAGTGAANEQRSSTGGSYQSFREKRLFRDTENAALGGVCSGLAHYVNIDVTIIRILFILLTVLGGSGILIYLVLLFVVPEAKTTQDKLQMRGQSINLDSIKEHFNKIKNDITENARSGRFRRSFNATVDKSMQAGSTVVGALSKVIGAAFLMGGVFALILLVTVLFGDSGFFPVFEAGHMESLPTLLGLVYPGDIKSDIVFICIIVVSLIPILAIILAGFRMLFRLNKPHHGRTPAMKTFAITATVTWLVAAGILVVTGIDLGMHFRSENSLEYQIPFTDSSNVLYVDVAPDEKFSSHIFYDEVWRHTELVQLENDRIYFGFPELYVTEKGDSGLFEIYLYKHSNGLSNKDAIEKAGRIVYPVTATGNRLVLPPYFSVPAADRIRAQYPLVEIRVPAGKQVKLGAHIDRIDVSVNGQRNYYVETYSNTTWSAGENGMRCLECKPYPESDHDHFRDWDPRTE